MINNIWCKIIAGKINKIPEFYTIFARKMPDYIIRSRPGRGQSFEAEAEAEAEVDLTSLTKSKAIFVRIISKPEVLSCTHQSTKAFQQCKHAVL